MLERIDAVAKKSRYRAEVTLRPLEASDEAFLRRLYASTRTSEMALVPWPDEQKGAFLKMQFEAQHSSYRWEFPGASFDVVEVRSEPVGRLYVDRREDEIRLIDIALLPGHRGRGIGGTLMEALLEEARAGAKRVVIHVERGNPARRWYRGLGFSEVEDLGIYFRMEWLPTESNEETRHETT
ncbi:MAG TPA: GNAT family N-acetyltransferase [Vicinamibacteria bacterium]